VEFVASVEFVFSGLVELAEAAPLLFAAGVWVFTRLGDAVVGDGPTANPGTSPEPVATGPPMPVEKPKLAPKEFPPYHTMPPLVVTVVGSGCQG
jgi:hypothetical protein